MLKSRPLFLVVVTLCLLMVVIATYWFALMPQRSLRNLQAELLATSGIVLEAKRARLDIGNGLGVMLEDVTLSNSADAPWQLTSKSVALPGLGGGPMVLTQAVLDVDVAIVNAGPLLIPDRIEIRDGILKLRDAAQHAVVAITDINGEVSRDGAKGLQGQLAMVWGPHVSDLVFNIEDLDRFKASGSPMDVTLKSKAMLFGFSGQGRADKGFKLAGQATVEAADTSSFFRWFGMQFQSLDGVGALTLQGGMETDGLALRSPSLTGDVGGVTIKGDLKLAAGADRPKLSGEVSLSQLSLWGPTTTGSVLSLPWSEAPLPFADARAAEFDLGVKTSELTLRGRKLGPLAFKLTADGPNTSIGIQQQAFAGGQLQGDITLDGAITKPQVSGAWSVKGVDAKRFLGGLFGFESLDGPIDIVANVQSEGFHLAALVSSLKGDLELQSSGVSLNGVNIPNALKAPRDGWTSEATSQVKLKLNSSIEEGVMKLGPVDIQAADIALKPQGEVDLLRQVFDLRLQAKGKGADPKMTLNGPWNKPVFSNATEIKEKAAVTPPAN